MTKTPLEPCAPSNRQSKRPIRGVANALGVYWIVSVLFALPYLLMAELGAWVFFRNWLRCISGPTVTVLHSYNGPVNALWPYATTLPILIVGLTGLLSLTPFRTLPRLTHVAIAFVWCAYGFVSTLAI